MPSQKKPALGDSPYFEATDALLARIRKKQFNIKKLTIRTIARFKQSFAASISNPEQETPTQPKGWLQQFLSKLPSSRK